MQMMRPLFFCSPALNSSPFSRIDTVTPLASISISISISFSISRRFPHSRCVSTLRLCRPHSIPIHSTNSQPFSIRQHSIKNRVNSFSSSSSGFLPLSASRPSSTSSVLHPLSPSPSRFRSFHSSSFSNASDPRPSSSSSSSSPSPKYEPISSGPFSRLASLYSQYRPRFRKYLAAFTLASAGYLVFKFGFSIVETMAEINFLDVAESAFLAGVVTGLGLVGVGWLASRSLRLHPERIFEEALGRVKKDSVVQSRLGTEMKTGSFRAYSFVPGTLRFNAKERQLTENLSGYYKYWKPRRLQLFFQVSSVSGDHAMVSAEVEKGLDGSHIYNLLCLDILDTGERIILAGDPNYKIYQGIIKLR